MENRRDRRNPNAENGNNQNKQPRSSHPRPYRGHNRGPRRNTQNRFAPNLTSLDGISNIFNDEQQPNTAPAHGQNNKSQSQPSAHSSGDNKNWRRKNYEPRKFGFKRLEELLEKESDELIFELLNPQSGLIGLVHSTNLSPDFLVLIVRLFSKMSECAFTSNTTKFLQIVTTDEILLQLKNFIMYLQIAAHEDKRKNWYFWKDPDDFFKHLYNYLEIILSLSPTLAIDVLPQIVKITNIVIPKLEELSGETVNMFEKIQEKLIMCQEEMTAKYKKKVQVGDSSDAEPPDNFRDISLCPLPIEITNRTRAFLRPNVIDGPYRSVDHYLDVQFRLLREDFVKPLREGICDYMENEHQRLQNVKIYKNVKFVSPHMVNGVCGVSVQMEIKDNKMFKKKLENSRRFMFGSLMCFTGDGFRSVIFGKIIERKPELLQNGMLVVEFQPGNHNITYGANYLMVESSVYFEPYYHVLKALQQLEESNFPMKQYIIEVQHVTEAPEYIASPSHVSNIFQNPITGNVKNILNDTQLEAYKSAMTQSFSIIQGPPGTGKTYLGLIIAKSLLAKHDIWHRGRFPMLVVCFTNHALDQFLEGLLSATQEIVRIGGQSKNKNLEKYNIRNLRKDRKYNRNAAQAFGEARNVVQRLHNELKKLHEALDKANQYLGIVNVLGVLQEQQELTDTWFGRVREQEFKDWLLGGRTGNERRREAAVMRPQLVNNEVEENDDSDDELPPEAYEDINERNQLDLDDNIFSHTSSLFSSEIYLISIESLKKEIQSMQDRRQTLETAVQNNYDYIKLDAEITLFNNILDYIEVRMDEGRHKMEFNRPDFINFNAPNNILPQQRWDLYFYWLNLYRTEMRNKVIECENQYQDSYKAYEELREIEDVEVMRENLIVGMTTTGAARLRGSLRALKSPIVIVEEAAEIMEAHVVTSLTEHCKHLILIGDHQQLRPNTADYTLEKKYFLGISLFERMIRNDIHRNVLSVQHRMRPSIARLIAPNIYPHLENHDSVNHFPPVRGVTTCLYFIDHKNPEQECSDQSKSNIHEVKFLLRLAKYFLLNGYEPEDITILAAYSGQMFAMFKERRKYELLKDVRISVLDNYQGEESKIILLSLVRNNNDGKIGFLSIDNRVCVALSRAREGLYIMGNMDMLSGNSQIWPKIRKVLEDQNSLGDALSLRCQIHYSKITQVRTESDFYKVSEGGCDLICGETLACGHKCKSQCHILNREHNDYKCKEKCTKILCETGHKCPKFCFQDCGDCIVPMPRQLKCGHILTFPCFQTEFLCSYPVSVELPCKHQVDNKPCYLDVNLFVCPYPCDARLDECGHSCMQKCHIRTDPDHLQYKCYKPCPKYRKNCSVKKESHICPKLCYEECPECLIVVKKTRSCTHVFNVSCHADVETVNCEKPCKNTLTCGHKCKAKCMEPCNLCREKVHKVVASCGHKVKVECYQTPTKLDCKQDCPSALPCGHKCKRKCRDPCTEKCGEMVDCSFVVPCGHSLKVPCYMNNLEFIQQYEIASLLPYCRHPCTTKLECDHACAGSCGECYQGRIHKTCMKNCGVPLICGHECTSPCRDACPPCKKKCMYTCPHSKCKKLCGEICTPCTELCPRTCQHVRCTAKCGAKCNTPPCEEPCRKRLKCGHICVGFCGEPCPPLCMTCNKDELLEIFFGTEEEDARFVYLEECKHVVESEGMEMWLAKDESEINVKRCPKCKTPLSITRRYNEYIKASIEEIQKVKLKFVGSREENEVIRESLRERLENISNSKLRSHSNLYATVFTKFSDMLEPVLKGRKQPWSKNLGQVLTSKIQVLENICMLFDDCFSSKQQFNLVMFDRQKRALNLAYIEFLLNRLIHDENRMTGQEVNDYKVELKRLRRILQLGNIRQAYPLVVVRQLYKTLVDQLYTFRKYNENDDYRIKNDFEKLSKEVGGSLCVTDKEMKDIVIAVGVKNGAWFKCPNGHPYAIGECGGAMEESECPDCGAKIGGTSHRLVSSNRHFNVDGSHFAAWSEQANMENYDFD